MGTVTPFRSTYRDPRRQPDDPSAQHPADDPYHELDEHTPSEMQRAIADAFWSLVTGIGLCCMALISLPCHLSEWYRNRA